MTLARLRVGGSTEVVPLKSKISGIVMERANGNMFAATSSPFTINKSLDGGTTWVQKFAEAHPNRNARLNFEDSRGNLFFGTALTNNAATINRSVDGGETWAIVLTLESDSAWYMIERNNGDLYFNEYNSSNTTMFAYNIWKSTDGGATWSKFYTHPPGNDPSDLANRTIRHFHMLWRDANDQMYLSMAHGLDTGAYFLNDNGTLGANIGDYTIPLSLSKGGGLTAFVQADNGTMFMTPDNYPSCVYKYQPNADTKEGKLLNVHDIVKNYGDSCDSFMLGMSKGRYGVLYAIGNGTTANRPYLLASGDDGASWHQLVITNEGVRPTFVSISRSTIPRIHIDMGINRPFITLPDYTKAQIIALQKQ